MVCTPNFIFRFYYFVLSLTCAHRGEGILKVLDADCIIGHTFDAQNEEKDGIVIGDASLAPSEVFWEMMSHEPNQEIFILSTREEVEEKGLSTHDCPACGVVFFREGRTQIMIGRKERSKDVVWAGNPDEPKLRIGGILSPRNSFDVFMQKARMESKAWTPQDINVISVLRDRICEHAHNYMLKLLHENIEDSNRKYMDAISRARDNYEFFAQMSHELRTPFHGVLGCLNILHDSLSQLSEVEVMDLLKTGTLA